MDHWEMEQLGRDPPHLPKRRRLDAQSVPVMRA